MASPEEPNGAELQFALNDDPVAIFHTDVVKSDNNRITVRDAEFQMPPHRRDWLDTCDAK